MRNRTTRAAHTIPSQEDNLMLARLRKAQENNEGGFTLIELLVVMIIIGILAAIAIPAFLNQKTKAKETSAKSDATNISKEFAAALVDGDLASIAYAATTVTGGATAGDITITYSDTNLNPVVLGADDYNVTAGNVIEAVGGLGSDYCISVQAYKDAVNKTGPIGEAWVASNNGLVKGGTCSTTTGLVS